MGSAIVIGALDGGHGHVRALGHLRDELAFTVRVAAGEGRQWPGDLLFDDGREGAVVGGGAIERG